MANTYQNPGPSAADKNLEDSPYEVFANRDDSTPDDDDDNNNNNRSSTPEIKDPGADITTTSITDNASNEQGVFESNKKKEQDSQKESSLPHSEKVQVGRPSSESKLYPHERVVKSLDTRIREPNDDFKPQIIEEEEEEENAKSSAAPEDEPNLKRRAKAHSVYNKSEPPLEKDEVSLYTDDKADSSLPLVGSPKALKDQAPSAKTQEDEHAVSSIQNHANRIGHYGDNNMSKESDLDEGTTLPPTFQLPFHSSVSSKNDEAQNVEPTKMVMQEYHLSIEAVNINVEAKPKGITSHFESRRSKEGKGTLGNISDKHLNFRLRRHYVR